MSEVALCFLGLGVITLVEYCIIVNYLTRIEEKINKLKQELK